MVLAYKIDRFSRSPCTKLIDTTLPEGLLMFHQFGSFAQYERELIGQRTRFGMMKRLRGGLWNGIPPCGYRIFRWYLQQNLGAVAGAEVVKQGRIPSESP